MYCEGGYLIKTRKAPINLKAAKQLTLDNLPNSPPEETNKATLPIQERQIIITEIGTTMGEDELKLKIGFKLLPSKAAFSKLMLNLSFDNQLIRSVQVRIPQGPLARDDSELPSVLDMTGIAAGPHFIKVGKCMSRGLNLEKLFFTSKEVTVEYASKTRASRLIRIPIVKSIGDGDLIVVSESDKNIYREIEDTNKKESVTKRDEW